MKPTKKKRTQNLIYIGDRWVDKNGEEVKIQEHNSTSKKWWGNQIPTIYAQIMRSAVGSQRPVGQEEAKEFLKDFIASILATAVAEERERNTKEIKQIQRYLIDKINDPVEYMKVHDMLQDLLTLN